MTAAQPHALVLASGGHPPPLVLRADGSVEGASDDAALIVIRISQA